MSIYFTTQFCCALSKVQVSIQDLTRCRQLQNRTDLQWELGIHRVTSLTCIWVCHAPVDQAKLPGQVSNCSSLRPRESYEAQGTCSQGPTDDLQVQHLRLRGNLPEAPDEQCTVLTVWVAFAFRECPGPESGEKPCGLKNKPEMDELQNGQSEQQAEQLHKEARVEQRLAGSALEFTTCPMCVWFWDLVRQVAQCS